MTRIYLPSIGPEDWRRFLGNPKKHWRTGYSAKTIAYCWEEAKGLPSEIATLLKTIGEDPRLLIGIPEHKVPLPGSIVGDSQNDLFALVRAGGKTVAVTIEGKVNEPFDQPMSKWLLNASQGKRDRLTSLCETLGLCQPLPDDLHYQLLHRTASAVLEARAFKTDAAAMIVHSFSPESLWFDSFTRFAALFGVTVEADKLVCVRPHGIPPLYNGWASGNPQYLQR